MLKGFPLQNICLLVVCSFFILLPSLAQTKRAMNFEDIVALNRASDTQMTSDGRRVAYVVTAWDREADRFNSDIYVSPAEYVQPATRLTFNPRNDYHPRWSFDGRRLAFLSERGNVGESTLTQIYLIGLQGGEPQPLTTHKTGVLAFAWSADGRSILFLATEPKPEIEPKPKSRPPVVVDEDARGAQLWIINTETRETTQLTKGRRHITDFDWSMDGRSLAFAARPSPRLADSPQSEIFLLDSDQKNAPMDTAQAMQLTRQNGAESRPAFSPDGRMIAWLAKADGDPVTGPDRLHVTLNPKFQGPGVVPLSGGETVKVLAKSFDGYIRSYRWSNDSRTLFFQADVGLNAHIFSTDISDRRWSSVTSGEGVNTSFSASFDGYTTAYVHEDPMSASEVMTISARSPVPLQLTKLNPQCEGFTLGRVESFRWKSNDGTDIEGLLIYPAEYDSAQRYPLITYLHGGPEGAYTRSFNASWGAFPQIYSTSGYAVFMPNFRGSSNYGAAFAQANKLKVGKVDYEDILSGIDALVKRGLADENRLAIAGWSYGGYLGGWMIGHTNRFRCAAYGAGLSNAVSYWATADIQWSRERLHGGTPWENRKGYEEMSPLTYLHQAKTPTLIFHGEKDERVPLGQSRETYLTLKRLGIPVQLVIYPDQGHSIQMPSYQLDKMRREFEWMEKYLKKK